jgi:serine/threonine protein kinase
MRNHPNGEITPPKGQYRDPCSISRPGGDNGWGACATLAGEREMKESWNLEQGAPIGDGRTVLEPLGGGTRYEVFLVRDEALGVEAVAKVLRPSRVDDERAVNALRREASFFERLDHPVLVRGLGSVLDGPYPHLLLEYVDGANLRDVLRTEATLPVGEALELAIDLLEAVAYFARNEVVHLDVKPSNILMTDPPQLIDLGAARTFTELEARRTPIGTAAYMAPEQCEPGSTHGVIGPPADVWGVGTTLFHALTGNRPFSKAGPRGSAPFERYRQLVEEPRPIPDYVPEPVARAVRALLARDPAERPTADEAARSLEQLAGEYADP